MFDYCRYDRFVTMYRCLIANISVHDWDRSNPFVIINLRLMSNIVCTIGKDMLNNSV